ncbi:MAG: PilZN3 domain-containing protein [Spirochaetaceae bacterium]
MAVTTSQQITRYYEQFRNIDVTFTKEVIRATLLYPKQVFLKSLGYQWPCIVYSSSMVGAKIIVNMGTSLREAIRKANNVVSLRFSFLQKDKADPLSFFVSAKITGATPYGSQKPDLHFLTLAYTQRPPDDLIEVLGKLLDAHAASKRRKEQRIPVTADSARKIGINAKNIFVYIEGVPRRCIIRDLSFGGAKLIILGVAKFLVNKSATLRVQVTEDESYIDIEGTVIRFEAVEGRNDIAAIAVKFHEETLPVTYKMLLSAYLRGSKIKNPEQSAES